MQPPSTAQTWFAPHVVPGARTPKGLQVGVAPHTSEPVMQGAEVNEHVEPLVHGRQPPSASQKSVAPH